MPLEECFVSFRGKSTCGRLTDRVGIYFLFTDDDGSSWTQQQIDVLFADAYIRLDALEAKAGRWKVSLELYIGYRNTKVAGFIDSLNKFDFRDTILKSCNYGLQNIDTDGTWVPYIGRWPRKNC